MIQLSKRARAVLASLLVTLVGIGVVGPARIARAVDVGLSAVISGGLYNATSSTNGFARLSSSTPAAPGTASVGTATTVARADHVHPQIGLVSARACLSQALPAYTFASSGGVGDTITLNSFAAMPAADGVTLSVGDEVFFPFGVSYFDSGLYRLTSIGNTTSTSTVLTRSTNLDTTAKILGSDVRISEGNSRRGAIYHYVNNPTIVWGTTAFGWMRIDASRSLNEYSEARNDFTQTPNSTTNTVSPNGMFHTVVGTAALSQAPSTITETGVWQQSATTATGADELYGTVASGWLMIDQSQYFELEVRMSGPNALSDGTNTFRYQFGLGNVAGTAQTEGLYVEYNQGVDTHWLVTAMHASSPTTIAGATVPASNLTYHRYRLVKYMGETGFNVWEDNVSLGTITTHQPLNVPLVPISMLVKTVGTTARTENIDSHTVIQAWPGRGA